MNITDEQKRIIAATEVAAQYGMVDGAHHKQWVIDQMLRVLLGKHGYEFWVSEQNKDPEYRRWDTGIAP